MFDCTNDELFTKGMESQLIIYLFVIVKKTPPVRSRRTVKYRILSREYYSILDEHPCI